MPLSYHPDIAALTHHPDLDDLQASVADLGRARERFLDAARHCAETSAERTEMAAADLLRNAVTLSRKLRHALSALMVAYATLWGRAHRSAEAGDIDHTNDFDDTDGFDHVDVRVWALERLSEKLELLIEDAGKTSRGRSRDGQVAVAVDDGMRLVELDFDPQLLSDPAYKASVIEAVNDGIGPVFRRRQGVADAVLPEPLEETPEAADGGGADDAAMNVFGALCGVDQIQLDLARLLPRIEDRRLVAECADLIAEICQDSEESLRDDLAPLERYRSLLSEKASLPGVTAGDLTGLESVAELFLEMELDEHFELETVPGVDLGRELRALVATVADELQRQDAERKERLLWRCVARRTRSRVAEVEQQTFEGRSRDGMVTARARGSVQLIDLQLDTDCHTDRAGIKTSVIEAVNAAIDEAMHRRSMMMMIEPPG